MQSNRKANELRKNSTDAERKLWSRLRNRQVNSCKFRRQVPIGRYIVDFASIEAGVIVELDGGQHAEQLEYDRARTQYLEKQGFRVFRYWNNEVLQDIDVVLNDILKALEEKPPSP